MSIVSDWPLRAWPTILTVVARLVECTSRTSSPAAACYLSVTDSAAVEVAPPDALKPTRTDSLRDLCLRSVALLLDVSVTVSL